MYKRPASRPVCEYCGTSCFMKIPCEERRKQEIIKEMEREKTEMYSLTLTHGEKKRLQLIADYFTDETGLYTKGYFIEELLKRTKPQEGKVTG